MDNDSYLRILDHRLKENDDWYQQTAKMLGISNSTFWILYMLYDYPDGITQKDICSMSCFPKQTINSALKKLETEGIITLIPGNNKRSKKIVLTAAGSELVNRTVVRARAAEYAALNDMTDEEKQALITTLDKFTRLLNEATYIVNSPPPKGSGLLLNGSPD